MYTIREAAGRTGIPIALLRAWERRYRVVTPVRTEAGYRLYDDIALDRLRTMRRLVESGWQPSVAAIAILDGTAPQVDPRASERTADAALGDLAAGAADPLIPAFVVAAAALDTDEIERVLDEMFARGTFEYVADRSLLPALSAVGDAWADGRVDVAGEHAASHAVLRRLAAAFQAAGRAPTSESPILVGLPPGGRHELGALAFAVAARRAGLPIVYLGPDLPIADWAAAAERGRARAAVIATPTDGDVPTAVAVADALALVEPPLLVAFGGRGAERAVGRAGSRETLIALPQSLSDAVDALRAALDRAEDRAG